MVANEEVKGVGTVEGAACGAEAAAEFSISFAQSSSSCLRTNSVE